MRRRGGLTILMLCGWLAAALPAAEVVLVGNARTSGKLQYQGGKFLLDDGKGRQEQPGVVLAYYRENSAYAAAVPAACVCLRDGSVLAGGIIAGQSSDELRINRKDDVTVTVKLADVVALELNPLERGISPEKQLPGTGLIMTNGKVMPSSYEWISVIEVGIKTDAGRLRLSRNSIHRVVLNAGGKPGQPVFQDGRALVLTLSGDALYGKLESLTDGVLKLTTLAGPLAIAEADLFAIVLTGGRSALLSALKPAKVVTKSYLDYIRPPVFDQSFTGGLLRVRGIVLPAGVLMHSRTEISYALDGAPKVFCVFTGLDQTYSSGGEAVFEIYCDGKKAAGQELNARQAPQLLSVNLDKVKELKLVLDYGSGGSSGDHGVWGVPVLSAP